MGIQQAEDVFAPADGFGNEPSKLACGGFDSSQGCQFVHVPCGCASPPIEGHVEVQLLAREPVCSYVDGN